MDSIVVEKVVDDDIRSNEFSLFVIWREVGQVMDCFCLIMFLCLVLC